MFDACPSAEDRSIPAETRAEKRMRRLSRMADIGVAIAEKLERQAELAAVYSETDAVPDNLPHSKRLDEIGRTFAQVSRAVSLATALEDRIDQGLPALPDDDRAFREREVKEKRAEVARAVVHAIEADPHLHSRRRVVELRLRLDRLLDAETADLQTFLRRPFPEIETRLRRDLGLDPKDDLPSPLVGEGGPAMPDLGESRGKAHGGGCGVTLSPAAIPSASQASGPSNDSPPRQAPKTRPKAGAPPHPRAWASAGAPPGSGMPVIRLPQGEKDARRSP